MEQWGWRMCSAPVLVIWEGRVSMAAGQCASTWLIFGHVPPIMGWTPRAGSLPWPVPWGILKFHPEKQVRHWNASVTSGAQELRAGFKTERVSESLQGVLNVLMKTFSIYLIVHITEKREDLKYLLFCCCCGSTCLSPARALQGSHLSLCLLQSELLTWIWHREQLLENPSPPKCCLQNAAHFLSECSHTGDTYSSCPLLISFLCQAALLQRLQMKVRKGG